MTEQSTQRVANLNPKFFKDTPVCELSFEEALKVGAKKCDDLGSDGFKETSIRFRVSGLADWYQAYACLYQVPIATLVRNTSWYCSSFCLNNPNLSNLVDVYNKLRDDITRNTDYVDLVTSMRDAPRMKEFGRSEGYPLNVMIPREVQAIISDCAAAVGISPSSMLQIGMAVALSSNHVGLYRTWSGSVVVPLVRELKVLCTSRVSYLNEIRNRMEFRTASSGGVPDPGNVIRDLIDALN